MTTRRQANDGRFYSRSSFLAWYGSVRGPVEWDQADKAADAKEPSAQQAGAFQERQGKKSHAWRVCIRCHCFEPFAGITDECCLVEFGHPCVFDREKHQLKEAWDRQKDLQQRFRKMKLQLTHTDKTAKRKMAELVFEILMSILRRYLTGQV